MAAIREEKEETGYLLSVERLVYIQERFYNINNVHHHEEKIYWLPIDELQNTNIVPEFLRTALTNISEEIVHIISKE